MIDRDPAFIISKQFRRKRWEFSLFAKDFSREFFLFFAQRISLWFVWFVGIGGKTDSTDSWFRSSSRLTELTAHPSLLFASFRLPYGLTINGNSLAACLENKQEPRRERGGEGSVSRWRSTPEYLTSTHRIFSPPVDLDHFVTNYHPSPEFPPQ